MQAPRNQSLARRLLLVAVLMFCLLSLVASGLLLAFYIQADSAARVRSVTGTLVFSTPVSSAVSGRLAWPLEHAVVCAIGAEQPFIETPPKGPAPCGNSVAPLFGTLWFSPGLQVTLTHDTNGTEAFFEPELATADAASLLHRDIDGNLHELSLPTRLILARPGTPNARPLVLPLVSAAVDIGVALDSQMLANTAVLETGSVALVRESFIGEALFSSEQFSLSLGDLLELRAEPPHYVQGVLRIHPGAPIDVALTLHDGTTTLRRPMRDPVNLNAPLAVHLVRDPSLVITWAFISLVFGAAITLLQMGPARKVSNE